MPYLKIQTNKSVRKKTGREILHSVSELVAVELGKPQDLVMVALEPETRMLFAGSDKPVAFLELKSIGIKPAKTRQLSQGLAALISLHLKIPEDRVYMKFINVPRGMWGWKGRTI